MSKVLISYFVQLVKSANNWCIFHSCQGSDEADSEKIFSRMIFSAFRSNFSNQGVGLLIYNYEPASFPRRAEGYKYL